MKHRLIRCIQAACLFCLVAFLLYLSGCGNKPYDRQVTADALKSVTETCSYILVKADRNLASDDKESPAVYFELAGSADFSDLFQFDDWAETDDAPTGEPVLIFRFAEAWLLELHSDGTAGAYQGYAASGTKPQCYYTFSAGVLEDLLSYIETHGIILSAEDGAISETTFHH